MTRFKRSECTWSCLLRLYGLPYQVISILPWGGLCAVLLFGAVAKIDIDMMSVKLDHFALYRRNLPRFFACFVVQTFPSQTEWRTCGDTVTMFQLLEARCESRLLMRCDRDANASKYTKSWCVLFFTSTNYSDSSEVGNATSACYYSGDQTQHDSLFTNIARPKTKAMYMC